MTCKERILSEKYGELIVDFTLRPEAQPQSPDSCYTRIDSRFGVAYVPQSVIDADAGALYTYHFLPRLFGLMRDSFDPGSLLESGILGLQRPPLALGGRGVVIAFIDTGIRFAMPEFLDRTGESRILAIWDQTLQTGPAPEGYGYGTVFDRRDINAALKSGDPYGVLFSYDEDGHGTAMAGVAAGSALQDGSGYTGAAPEAELVVVKLRPAKKNLRDFYMVPDDAPAYAESDIMLGVRFAESFAETFARPVVICLGVGTNAGDHVAGSSLAQYLDSLARQKNRGVVVCGGNEGNAGHHYSGRIPADVPDAHDDVEIRVGEGERGFLLELWGKMPGIFHASLRTPGGEGIPRFRLGLGQSVTYRFVYERTRVTVDSILVEPSSGEELIVFRFEDPTAGIWTVSVESDPDGADGEFDMWLPVTQFLRSDTRFLRPDPYMTLTDPGVSPGVITPSAYSDLGGSFYADSGRGYLPNGLIKPDFAAPGVEVSTPLGRFTGSCMAAAVTAGAVAQYLEWAVVRRNNYTVENQEIKACFIRGAKRDAGNRYPNREWGYGRLDAEGVFEAITAR